MYFWVVERLECPSISWMARRSAPPARRCVAKEWRSTWGLTFFDIPLTSPYFFIILARLLVVMFFPLEFRNR